LALRNIRVETNRSYLNAVVQLLAVSTSRSLARVTAAEAE
jgi:hypothetical protein